MKPIYPLNLKNDFYFKPTARDFIVEEIPLYDFTGEGEHLVLKIRKKEMTTWGMLDALGSYLGIRKRDIGYAGLKDKHAMTVQYISLPAKYESVIRRFEHSKIKVLDMTRHNNKIRVGHLKGNRFEIRLKKVLGIQKEKLDSVLDWVENNGVPNYFGNQRFGTKGDNWEEGRKLLRGEIKMRDKKTKEFLMGAYQSHLFNRWLAKRMEISLLLETFDESEVETLTALPKGALEGTKRQPHFFKLLKGDMMMHYPYGKLFEADDIRLEAQRFYEKDIAPTGLIPGSKTKRAALVAGIVESCFDESLKLYGARRYAWVQVTGITRRYIEEKAHYELGFELPKGSYATNVLDLLRGEPLSTSG